MQILVVCRPVPDIDQSEFRRIVPAESAALRELREQGVLANAWTPGRPGAVLILEAGTEDEGAAIAAALPPCRLTCRRYCTELVSAVKVAEGNCGGERVLEGELIDVRAR